jgi:hypothetical protein
VFGTAEELDAVVQAMNFNMACGGIEDFVQTHVEELEENQLITRVGAAGEFRE